MAQLIADKEITEGDAAVTLLKIIAYQCTCSVLTTFASIEPFLILHRIPFCLYVCEVHRGICKRA